MFFCFFLKNKEIIPFIPILYGALFKDISLEQKPFLAVWITKMYLYILLSIADKIF